MKITTSVLRLSFDEIIALEKKSLSELREMIVKQFEKYGNKTDLRLLHAAFVLGSQVHANQKRETGAPYFTHPLISALMMMEYEPSVDLIIAVLLHDAIEDSEDPEKTAKHIAKVFGESTLYLIEGVSKVFSSSQTLEKLFALAEKDVRILIVKLFDRLHNTITILGKTNIQKREKKLKETIRIYVPLAERLGLWSVKKKLEDAVMLGISPVEYHDIVQFQNQSDDLQHALKTFFENHSFSFPVEIEIKKYSASSVIKAKKNNPYLLPDETFFVRCIVPKKADCYVFLEEISALLPQKKSLFSDFILRKKENNYQALHSTHIFQNEHAIELHIVSEKMKEQNDKGIFLKLLKKEYSLSLLHGIDIHKYIQASEDFISVLSMEILLEKITVHGKDFQSKTLPKKSRILDALIASHPLKFAYCTAVLRNGKPAMLSDPLEDHDIIDFTFSDEVQITHDWKKYTLLVSSQTVIDFYFSDQEKAFKIEQGRKIMQNIMNELRRGDAELLLERYPFLQEKLQIFSIDDLFIAIYEQKINPSTILSLITLQKSQSWRKWFSFLAPRQFLARVHFFCNAPKPSADCIQQVSHLAEDKGVQIMDLQIRYDFEKKTILGNGLFKSNTEENILQMFEAFTAHKNFSYHIIPAWKFWLKISMFLMFPILIAFSIFLFLFSDYAAYYSEFLYLLVFIIVFSNIFSYVFLAKYFAMLRYTVLFWGILIVSNVITTGVFLFFFFQKQLDIFHVSFFLPFLVLLFSIFFPVLLLSKKEKNPTEPSMSLAEWKEKQKQKKIGYALRFASVLIWGVEPIIIKYSPFSIIPPFEKLFLYSFGAFVTLTILFLLVKIKSKFSSTFTFSVPFNRYFIFIFIGFFFLNYLTFHSLLHTNSTNFILLNNFAPTFALIVAYILWRKKIPYLQEKKNALMIFGVFLLGGIGSSFLFYNDLLHQNVGNILGNTFAILAIAFDALIVISQIQYTKSLKEEQSFLVNIYLFGLLFLLMLPFVLSHIFSFPTESLLWGALTGGLIGIALMLNYETFKRMDGFIAYLMLNISVFLTFVIETFVLKTFSPTWLIFLGGLFIISASIFAELINTKAEKRQVITS